MFGAYCVTVITGQVERLNRSTGDILDLTVTKKKQLKGNILRSSSPLRRYELSMVRDAHLSGGAS